MTNAFLAGKPTLQPIGPTVDDDVRRAINLYGIDAVKRAIKDMSRARNGRPRLPDNPLLIDMLRPHAKLWIEGSDPFETVKNYSIAKAYSERNPGQSAASTLDRIERKLRDKHNGRKFITFAIALEITKSEYPHDFHIRAIRALIDTSNNKDFWLLFLENALSYIGRYKYYFGISSDPDLTMAELIHQTDIAQNKQLADALIKANTLATAKPKGMFGNFTTREWPS